MMDKSLLEKYKDWLCRIFDHKPINPWLHKCIHADCKRCGKTVTACRDGWR